MTPQIKQRIEQIKAGQVPDGYKKSRNGIVPNNWDDGVLGNYIQEYRQISNDIEKYSIYSSSRQGLIPQSQYYDKREAVETNLGYKIVPNEYVTYRHMSDDDIFHFNINNTGNEVLVSVEYPVFTSSAKGDLGYIIPMLNDTARFRYFCRLQKLGGTRTRLYYKNLCTYKASFPSLPEQEKIAEILSAQDKLIELQEKLLEEKKKQKKYLMQQLLTGKKRLPGFSEEWKKTKYSSCFEFISGYPFSSALFNENTGMRIIRNRDLKSDDQIIYTTEFCSAEYRINNGDILVGMDGDFLPCIWNKGEALLNQRVGRIVVFNEYHERFIYYTLFQSLKKLQNQKGATTVKHLANNDFENMYHIMPCDLYEQSAIAKMLCSADNEIELLQKELYQEKQKKKALMQLLLTGIVRV